MSEVLQANIFFVITSIAVVVFTLLLCVLLYHIIKITKSVRRIVDRVEASSERMSHDITRMRTYFAEHSLGSILVNLFLGKRKKNQKKNKMEPASEPKEEMGATTLSVKEKK